MTGNTATTLRARALSAGYGRAPVCQDIDLTIEPGEFVAIIGPNGCGKSTLLRGLCRLLAPMRGQVTLDGQDMAHIASRKLARRIGLLPQSATAPAGITVADLVARGRYPHQRLFRQWSNADSSAVADAMAATGITELADDLVEQLSGGQRQRVWVAMALAQETPLLFLDEPTTYLDIAHQIELLDLLADLNAGGRTLVAVLHDLNQACRYAGRIVVMQHGRIVADGTPADVIRPELLRHVFGLDALVIPDPVSATPMVVPRQRQRPVRPF